MKTPRSTTAAASLSRVQSEVIRKIVEYVQREQFSEGVRLTEIQLAAEVGVSRSPVRSALRALEEAGVVTSVKNKGGFYLARDARLIEAVEGPQDQLSDVALYDRIVRDRLVEQSEQFTEAEFMRRYDVSRAQLVRTLARMTSDGIVQRSTGQGWKFLQVLDSDQAYAASYRFRLLIEPAGLLEPTFQVDRKAIERSRDDHHRIQQLAGTRRLDGREVFETNAEFHAILAKMSGNRFIHGAIDQQNRLRRLSEYYVYEDVERIHVLCREHCEIMDALTAGDREWASTLLRRHLEIASRQRPPFQSIRQRHDRPADEPEEKS